MMSAMATVTLAAVTLSLDDTLVTPRLTDPDQGKQPE